jgi:hypothetical protein
MRSRGVQAKAVNPTTAAITLVLALTAGLVVFKVKTRWEYRVVLALGPGFLIYWFISQVRMIRARQRHTQPDDDAEV